MTIASSVMPASDDATTCCMGEEEIKRRIEIKKQCLVKYPNCQLPMRIVKSCEIQCVRQAYFKVIDNTNELAVQFMYCNVFAMAFPMAPLLFLANTIIEFNMDLYRLFDRRRPIPTASSGLADIWHIIFDGIIYLSVLANMLWCSYHTNLTELVTGSGTIQSRIMFFTAGTGIILLVLIFLQICIKDQPEDVEDHLARQRKVELRMVSRAATPEHVHAVMSNQKEVKAIKEEMKLFAGKRRDSKITSGSNAHLRRSGLILKNTLARVAHDRRVEEREHKEKQDTSLGSA